MALPYIRRLHVPSAVAVDTNDHLAAMGRKGVEGMALWVGKENESLFDVSQVYIPKQHGTRGDHGLLVSVPLEELQRLNVWLYRNNLRLIAQIHSHPTEAYHSEVDDRYAIATRLGSFSIVVPDFAVRPFNISQCAVYRLSPSRWRLFSDRLKWRRLSAAEAVATIHVVE